VDIRKQDVIFFSTIRKLNSTSEDPKYLNNEHVTMEECIALFGGSRKFELKCLKLKFKDRAAIKEIYWRVFGTSSVTNNEIFESIMHGFIAQGKGIDINWAKVVESTTKEKARRDDAKGGGHLTTMKKERAFHPINSGSNMDVIVGQLRSQLHSMKIGVEYGDNANVLEDNIE
jgi:hypothetical protein